MPWGSAYYYYYVCATRAHLFRTLFTFHPPQALSFLSPPLFLLTLNPHGQLQSTTTIGH